MPVAFTGTIEPTYETALPTWDAMAREGGASPFQTSRWLAAWAATLGRDPALQVLAVTLYDAADQPVAGLPLVRERRGLRRIGFADGGLCDYNAPILGRAAPEDEAGGAELWRALIRALPASDVVRFERMPRRVGARVNPFALLKGASPSEALGLALPLGQGYAAWLATRPRRYRMELGRCARLFEALPGARFERVDPGGAEAVLAELERLQRSRITALDKPYALDAPRIEAFHRALTADREAGILYALRAETRVVAILFGLRVGPSFTMLRVAADPDYGRLSPARLVIVRAMEALACDGVTTIDLGRGDYDYKRRLGGEPVALVDVVAARSLLGRAALAAHAGRAALRASPARGAALRLRGLVSRRPSAASPPSARNR